MGRTEAAALFLRDRERSWYISRDGREALLAHMRALIERHGYRALSFVGLSMGGYAALRFAQDFPQARVFSMSPAPSLDVTRFGPFVINPQDWLHEHDAFTGTDLVPNGDPARYFLLYGDDGITDIANMERFHRLGWAGLHVLPGVGHNIAGHLLRQGRLDETMRRFVAGEAYGGIAAWLGGWALHENCPSLLMLRARRHLYRGERAAARACPRRRRP